MAADTTYPNIVQIRQDGNLAVPTGKSIDVESGAELKIAGTAVTATAAELNSATDASARVVTVAAATTSLTVTLTEHSEKIIVLNTNNATGCTLTLPVASASGARYTIVNNVVQTQGTIIITCGTLDVISGVCRSFDTTAVATAATCFVTSATSDKITMVPDGTQGGEKGDKFVIVDIAANVYLVEGFVSCTGAKATPFAAT